MKGGQRRGGANFLSLSAEFREAAYTNIVTHKYAEYVHTGDWTGVRAIIVAFSHPLDTADNTVCKRWGFFIQNEFSALVSPALACPFFVFCSVYPAPKALAAFLYCVVPASLRASSPSPLLMCYRAPSSVPQLCKQWELFTVAHHRGAPGASPHHAHKAFATFAQVFHT